MYFNILVELLGYVLGLLGFLTILLFVFLLWKQSARVKIWKTGVAAILLLFCSAIMFSSANIAYPVAFAMPPTMHSHAPGGLPPSIPFSKIISFFLHENTMERVKDIGADPNAVPPAITRTSPDTVQIHLTAKEVIAEVAPGISYNYWTYNGTTPGPMLRVKEGDTVELSLTNDPTSLHAHNIDLHAVTGPGGGATVSEVQPGETKTFRFKAMHPGLYEYHCAMANVSVHNAHGQYGLMLVEPKEGLAPVDKEFYIMQGELYTDGQLGAKGFRTFNPQALLDGNPQYITFNGKIETAPRMTAKVGDKIRIFVGNGGVNTISSFHVIGEIFDQVYTEGGIGAAPLQNIQTTEVLPGGASIVEFTVDVPGKYLLVDHALARMNRGAWAELDVTGPENPDVFSPLTPSDSMEDMQ